MKPNKVQTIWNLIKFCLQRSLKLCRGLSLHFTTDFIILYLSLSLVSSDYHTISYYFNLFHISLAYFIIVHHISDDCMWFSSAFGLVRRGFLTNNRRCGSAEKHFYVRLRHFVHHFCRALDQKESEWTILINLSILVHPGLFSDSLAWNVLDSSACLFGILWQRWAHNDLRDETFDIFWILLDSFGFFSYVCVYLNSFVIWCYVLLRLSIKTQTIQDWVKARDLAGADWCFGLEIAGHEYHSLNEIVWNWMKLIEIVWNSLFGIQD